MRDVMMHIGIGWAAWCALQVVLWLAAVQVAKARGFVATNGVQIVVPDAVRAKLTEAEVAAVIAHERGHIHRLHVVKNLACSCLFIRRRPTVALRQEIEADDWAAARGHGPALASAIRKLSTSQFDTFRASRLERQQGKIGA